MEQLANVKIITLLGYWIVSTAEFLSPGAPLIQHGQSSAGFPVFHLAATAR
jgi:hypothetical protein